MNKSTKLLEDFDPSNIEHLKAIQYLSEHREFPENFFPNVPLAEKYMSVNDLMMQIGMYYIKQQLEGRVKTSV